MKRRRRQRLALHLRTAALGLIAAAILVELLRLVGVL